MINKKRLIQTFINLAKIDSVSGEEKEVAKEVGRMLKKLGAKVAFDSYGNLIAKFLGFGEPFLFNAHLDTVEPGRGIKPAINGDIIKSDGTTILGADPKAGIAIILETLKHLKENNVPHVPLEIVFTREEEIGLVGAINLDYSKITAKKGITIDGEYDFCTITISSPSYSKVDVTITGIGAHSGEEPEKGVSAIVIASKIISKLRLGRIDDETTANIGLIEGGSVRNAVPETAHFKGEIRSRDPKKLEDHTKHFENVLKQVLSKHTKAKAEVSIKKMFEGYEFSKNHTTIEQICSILEKSNTSSNLCHVGGATDVNIFCTKGIEAVVVGGCFYNAHTTREYAVISEMLKAVELCVKLVSA